MPQDEETVPTGERSLLLHIGHGKTGSSHLQAIFSSNRSVLLGHGIDYPVDAAQAQHRSASQGHISAGNAVPLATALLGAGFRSAAVSDLLVAQAPRALFSSEMLMPALSKPGRMDRLVEAARQVGYGRIVILLFARDPVAHAASSYVQALKRKGTTQTFDDFLRTYEVPRRVLELADTASQHREITMVVRNYTALRADLFAATIESLDIPADGFDVDDSSLAPTVNRSISLAEQALCKALTDAGIRPGIVSDALCNELPDIEPSYPSMSDRSFAELAEVLGESVERLNADFLPEAEALRFEPISNEPAATTEPVSAEFGFSAEQLAVIAHALATTMTRLAPGDPRWSLAGHRKRRSSIIAGPQA